MARRQNDEDGGSGVVKLLLILVIVGGLGYLAYDHQEDLKSLDIESLKRMVGLGEPEAPAPNVTTHPAHPHPPASEPSTTDQSTNTNTATTTSAVPVVGRPRPEYPKQDHWTWTTSDGKTYNDVQIEKIEGNYVTIIHADGGARVSISTLPDDLQKQLNYYSQ